jgi:hypothetical protein
MSQYAVTVALVEYLMVAFMVSLSSSWEFNVFRSKGPTSVFGELFSDVQARALSAVDGITTAVTVEVNRRKAAAASFNVGISCIAALYGVSPYVYCLCRDNVRRNSSAASHFVAILAGCFIVVNVLHIGHVWKNFYFTCRCGWHGVVGGHACVPLTLWRRMWGRLL